MKPATGRNVVASCMQCEEEASMFEGMLPGRGAREMKRTRSVLLMPGCW